MNPLPLYCLLLALAASLGAAETYLISDQTPWRVWVVVGKYAEIGPDGAPGFNRSVVKTLENGNRVRVNEFIPFTAENAELTPLPSEDWMGPSFDDSLWGRYAGDLQEWVGLYIGLRGRFAGEEPAVLHLRTRFGIADPAQATDLNLSIEYVGGVVAYVNGQELGRGHLPEGPLKPYTVATGYPKEAYVKEDGVTPLPLVRWIGTEHTLQDDPRVRLRVRSLNLKVPAKALVKGANVLALAVHRAPVMTDAPGQEGGRYVWRHQGIGTVCLSSASGQGAIAWSEALQGTRVWSAQPLEQVANQRAKKIISDCGRPPSPPGYMTFGLTQGNPFDPLRPVRIVVPRNGIGNGQTVLSDVAGLTDVKASLAVLTGPGGAKLTGARIRYGQQMTLEKSTWKSTGHWCDHLAEHAPQGAKTIPVWIEISAPKDQPPGEYSGDLSLAANGKRFTVPVQVLVTGFTVPDPKDFRSVIICVQSPEAVAQQYNLRPYSDEHFQMMEKTLVFMGQLGNKLLTVPVVYDGNMGHQTGMIRWVKTEGGLKPDYSLFEKYLDLFVKNCGQPKAITLNVWNKVAVTEMSGAYENIRFPTRKATPKGPLTVTCWDPKTGATEQVVAPQFTAEGAESFWKPMLDGVYEIVVKKRGWPERTILLGVGDDARPSLMTSELFRKWAPYARWEIVSHFSGDPGPKDGKLIIVGDLEVGLKEACMGSWAGIGDGVSASSLEGLVQNNDGFLRTALHREGPSMYSSPIQYRTVPVCGYWTRIGMDCWPKSGHGPGYYIWGEQPIWMTWPGSDGPQPTVRLQMVREGLQDFEARLVIAKRILTLPEWHRQPYRSLLNEIHTHIGVWNRSDPANLLPHSVLGFNWQSYVARVYAAAVEAGCTGRMVDGTPADDPKVTAAIRAETDPAKLLPQMSAASAHYRFEAVKRLGGLKPPLAKEVSERLVALALDDFYEEIRAQAVLSLDAHDPQGRAGWNLLMADYSTNFWSDPPPKEGWGYPSDPKRSERRQWIQRTLRALGEAGRARLERDYPDMAKDPVRLKIALDIACEQQWRLEPLVKAGLEVLQRGPLAQTLPWTAQVPINTGNITPLRWYFLTIKAATDPATAQIMLETCYPTYANHLKPDQLLAWLEPIALATSHPGSRERILKAWKTIGKPALPSMERVKTAMLAKGETDQSAAEFAKAIDATITTIKVQ